jgi:hypothetical protein
MKSILTKGHRVLYLKLFVETLYLNILKENELLDSRKFEWKKFSNLQNINFREVFHTQKLSSDFAKLGVQRSNKREQVKPCPSIN